MACEECDNKGAALGGALGFVRALYARGGHSRDRWGRSLVDSIRSIQELVSLGIRFLAVTQNIDTDESNPMSRSFLHVMRRS